MPREIETLPDFTPGELTFPPIPKFTYTGDLSTELAAGLTAEQALTVYGCMLYIRLFEEMVARLKQGKFPPLPDYKFVGATHLSIGQEAVAAGTISAINADDYITSTHRGHGHSIAKGFYALLSASDEHLLQFVGAQDSDDHQELLDTAIQEHLNRTMAELFGKEEGYCRGRGGGMHIADFNAGHLGANAIVGGSYGIATGAAMACEKLGNGKIVACLMGDGAANNGICHEAYNFATMAQFDQGTPVIYIIENNQYGMTGQQAGEVTGIRYLAQRGAGYNSVNMHAEVVNGMDVLAVRDAVGRAAQLCRDGQGPVLIECMTYRYFGHSLSDTCETYRTKSEEECWRAEDAIARFGCQLVATSVATEQELEQRRQLAVERIEQATLYAANATDPDPKTIYEGLLADTTSEDIGPEWATPRDALHQEPKKMRRDGQGRILFRHAIAEALTEEMVRDRRVIVYGEDVADYGGAFGATRGLLEVFGRERVFNTAISEAAIVGTGVGAALVGMRPVVELMYIDFILMAMDQVGNQAAKVRYMFGGKAKVPLVIRTSVGGGRGYAGQHSQSLEAVVCMFPGLKVVAPATAYDAKGLLKSAIRDDNPVIFIEHQHALTIRGEVPEEEYTVPIGTARVAREGTGCTLVAYSWLYYRTMEAAQRLEEEGISVEVIDLRTLVPLDADTITTSVKKTGHLVIIQQAPDRGCFGDYIAYQVQQKVFDALQAPINIVAAHNVPPPMAQPLEEENIPSVEKIVRAVRQTLGQQ